MPKGFTLLELLIVIAILAVLSTAVVLILNPAEAIKRARDTQRISDLDTLKTAIILWLTEGNTDIGATYCKAADICNSTVCCNPSGNACSKSCDTGKSARSNDGEGWIPIDFTSMSGGSPLSHLPVDPVNDATYYYEYAASSTDFELRTTLESDYYTTKQDIDANDGGEDADKYEVGTDLTII